MSRIVGGLPRHAAPSVAFETILERGRLRRRRLVLGTAGIAAAAVIMVAMFLSFVEPGEPPVHLEIEVVDIPDAGGQPGAVAAWMDAPEEARQP
ncbi:MAG: hypothetical protein ACYTGN_09795 [Planctomycetota bacterium]